ncbi:rhamnulokinase [Arthrobacter sp. Ld5]|uniref:rhamnulokinase n=1 Tax=Arthrobacter sp. Ld5 TaxID=649152 RepID=UPI003EBAAD9B
MDAGSTAVFVAVDIGASSGRVILGRITRPESGGTAATPRIQMEVVHRFPNGVVTLDGHLRWDFDALLEEVLVGLTEAARVSNAQGERVISIGIDTWAVDYGLVDPAGDLTAQPVSYRDDRTRATIDQVHRRIDQARLYSTTGLQFLPFNTVYQLAAEKTLDGVQALLMPDLLAYRLTGERRTESTNASTTGLFDAVAGEWATEIHEALGLPRDLFPPLVEAGRSIGALLPGVAERTKLPASTQVVAVGSHDTASAVAAVPAQSPQFAYISSGTWSLVGLELRHPVLTEASRAANFTNERGVDGTIRYLRNVGGLWLLSECQRTWTEQGMDEPLTSLLTAAAALPAGGPQVDVDDPAFIAPGGMPQRIQEAAVGAEHSAPGRPAAIVRCILDSLALGYARTIADAERLTDARVDVVHIVGGGSQNQLLCQLTADATGKPVIAGPVEATALGNLLIQARAGGQIDGDLSSLRDLVAAGREPAYYEPRRTAPPSTADLTSVPLGRTIA